MSVVPFGSAPPCTKPPHAYTSTTPHNHTTTQRNKPHTRTAECVNRVVSTCHQCTFCLPSTHVLPVRRSATQPTQTWQSTIAHQHKQRATPLHRPCTPFTPTRGLRFMAGLLSCRQRACARGIGCIRRAVWCCGVYGGSGRASANSGVGRAGCDKVDMLWCDARAQMMRINARALGLSQDTFLIEHRRSRVACRVADAS